MIEERVIFSLDNWQGWHCFFINIIMKRVCFTISLLLFISWVVVFLLFQAGFAAHGLVMLAILFFLHAVIQPAPCKMQNKLD
jgi:hypothetical protein